MLKKERSRRKKDKLKAQEESLKKQLEVTYLLYICWDSCHFFCRLKRMQKYLDSFSLLKLILSRFNK